MGYFVNLGQWRESVASSYGSQSEDQPLSRGCDVHVIARTSGAVVAARDQRLLTIGGAGSQTLRVA